MRRKQACIIGGMDKVVSRPRTGAVIRSPKVVARRRRIRDALLAAGARLFAEHGIDAVSVEELIAEVGISRRTFYGFFANKYELVAQLLKPVLESGEQELQALDTRDPAQIVAGIAALYLDQWARHRDALQLVGRIDVELLPYIEPGHTRFGRAMRVQLRRAEEAGCLRNDSADDSFKIISRTALPLLRIYAERSDLRAVYIDALVALLGRPDPE